MLNAIVNILFANKQKKSSNYKNLIVYTHNETYALKKLLIKEYNINKNNKN